MLPLMEPELRYRNERRTPLDPTKKLTRQVKREFKGAARELRKDSAFMRKTWNDEQLARDAVRRKKTNILMNDLGIQNQAFSKKK